MMIKFPVSRWWHLHWYHFCEPITEFSAIPWCHHRFGVKGPWSLHGILWDQVGNDTSNQAFEICYSIYLSIYLYKYIYISLRKYIVCLRTKLGILFQLYTKSWVILYRDRERERERERERALCDNTVYNLQKYCHSHSQDLLYGIYWYILLYMKVCR